MKPLKIVGWAVLFTILVFTMLHADAYLQYSRANIEKPKPQMPSAQEVVEYMIELQGVK